MAGFWDRIVELSDGDGRFELSRDGTRLEYHLGAPYNRVFSFVEPLDELEARLSSQEYGLASAGSGVSPIGLFAIHVWEAALTANDGEDLMRLEVSGIRTFRREGSK